jgi:acetyl-CoA C-acetyltransferase
MKSRDVVLCSPVRTAIGGFNGSLKTSPATELGAVVTRAALARAGLDAKQVDNVVFGNVVQAGNRMNPAKQAATHGGIPVSVPALTVNRVCGSGAQAIVSAAQEVWLGNSEIAIAGGLENMELAPYLMPGARAGLRMGPAQILDAMLYDGLHDAFSGEHSGWHTEDLVARYGLTREEQDVWAARSQQRFAAAKAAGHFFKEIAPIELVSKKGTTVFDQDEANRPDTTLDVLAKLKPAFRKDGTITAGNAPGLNAGAAAMIVTSRDVAESKGLHAMARLAAYGVASVEPAMFGFAPVPAIQLALQRAGWRLEDVERFEINEAFAAVPLVVSRELGLTADIVNVDGGAIAHGHPIGATGAILATRLLYAMQRDGIRRGIVSLCIGGGQGIALALEAL